MLKNHVSHLSFLSINTDHLRKGWCTALCNCAHQETPLQPLMSWKSCIKKAERLEGKPCQLWLHRIHLKKCPGIVIIVINTGMEELQQQLTILSLFSIPWTCSCFLSWERMMTIAEFLNWAGNVPFFNSPACLKSSGEFCIKILTLFCSCIEEKMRQKSLKCLGIGKWSPEHFFYSLCDMACLLLVFLVEVTVP